jgi:Leucine-rich repeat (LRR) protein
MSNIIFEDKGFESAVRENLHLSDGEITEDALLGVKGITVSETKKNGYAVPWGSDGSAFNMVMPNLTFIVKDSDNGKWVNDLKHFINAKSLHIQTVTEDLSGLKDMVNLKQLYITNSKNTDWSFLENLLHLDYLYIENSPFSDLTPLSKLADYQNEHESFHPILKKNVKTGLSHLHLIKCNITDISPLSKCIHIDDLDLSHNDIVDISPLSSLERLYYFTLRWSNVNDITPLQDLKSLYSLNLRHNKVKNLSPAIQLNSHNLSRLYMSDNPIEDYSVLKALPFVHSDITYRGERKFSEEDY